MRRILILEAARGGQFEISLENWGAGSDFLQRRWVLMEESWLCVDSGEIALEVGAGWPRFLGGRKSGPQIFGLLPI